MIVSDLSAAASELDLQLQERALQQFEDYLELLAKWNKVYNLTAIRESSKWVSHHLMDSLAVVRYLPTGSVIDVGSGAGLPGLPIAIACPSRQVCLLDSSHKKCAFLRQAAAELKLQNVSVISSRVQAYRPAAAFDVVISRAFSELSEFVACARHLCARGGRMLAMKGVFPDEEISQLPAASVERVQKLRVPLLDAERHLVIVDADQLGAI